MFRDTALVITCLIAAAAFVVRAATDGNFVEQDKEQMCLDLLQTSNRVVAVRKTSPTMFHQELDNDRDTSYVGNITVGGQILQAILDTGSFELLVFSKSCTTCGAAGTNGFDQRSSDSFHQGKLEQMMIFGSGSTYCRDASDTLELGPLSVKDQPLWEVYDAEMEILEQAEFQAILGLGPPAAMKVQAEMDRTAMEALEDRFEAAGAVVPARLQSRIQAKEKADEMLESLDDSVVANLGTRYLSICLEQAHGARGHVFWNDVRPDRRPEFTRLVVTGDLTWGMHLRNVKLVKQDGTTFDVACQSGCGAILDSGTSLISAPTSSIEAMMKILTDFGASCMQEDLPSLEFELGGKRHVLPADVYMGLVEGIIPAPWKKRFNQPPFMKVKDCELLMMDTGFMRTEAGPMWIIGMPFFRYYYSTFDYGEDMSDPQVARSIWTAPADSECHPLKEGEQQAGADESKAANLLQVKPRRVDQSRLRLPGWMANRADDHIKM